jgi:hypothetical protein
LLSHLLVSARALERWEGNDPKEVRAAKCGVGAFPTLLMTETGSVESRLGFGLALVALFGFRLLFGLSQQLFTEDETQIYLLGLRFFASGQWPYFGPDVVWTQTQIPGALQSLVVGLPFFIARIPEAPYLLLNVLSMGALALFAGYLSARLPELPRWLLWGWLFTLPWTLELSTHIINPSYVLPVSLIFFVCFMEAWPSLRIGRVPVPLAHAGMGAALGWVMQLHMSWPLLLPFIAAAFVARTREGRSSQAVAAFCGGFALTGALILPTWITYGIFAGGTGENIYFHWREPVSTFFKTLARLLAFSSYEINRFLGADSSKRIAFLQGHWWLVPAVLFVWLLGIVHPIWMALTAVRRTGSHADWPAVRTLFVATVLLATASFFFTVAWAQSTSFYVVAPVSFVYAAYCWTFIDSPRARRLAAVVLSVNLVVQVSLALSQLSGPSVYMDRPLLLQAIAEQTPGRFAMRRPWGRDVTPDVLASTIVDAKPAADLDIGNTEVSRYVRDVISWTFVVSNRSATVAYRDLLCEMRYFDSADNVVETGREYVRLVLQPGETRRGTVVSQTRWASGWAKGDLRVVDAEPLRPVTR